MSDINIALTEAGFTPTPGDSTIINLGKQMCKVRKDGAAEADVIALAHNLKHRLGISRRTFVRTAERELCPAFLAAAR